VRPVTQKLMSLLMLVIASFFAVACGTQGDDPTVEPPEDAELSLAFADPVQETVEGNVLELPVEYTGIDIVAPDGDTSGDTGHFHVFIDKDPVEAGEAIPVEAGVVHTADDPPVLYGLPLGSHELTIVVGNGAHERVGDVSDTVTVDVQGPTVDLSGPATLKEGEDLELELAADGVEIVAADSKRADATGHYHVLVDPKTAPEGGDVIPPAVENSIVHTPEDAVTISDLKKGEHMIWLVLGDGQHYAFDPPVMDRIKVTVS
jgi:hypothetical protein